MKIHVPKQYRPMYKRAMRGQSRKAAIRVHCLMCVGWQPGEVTKCTSTTCPLYPYRMATSSACGPAGPSHARQTAQQATIAS